MVARTSFAYDQGHRLIDMTHRNQADAVLDRFALQYDGANRIIRLTDIDGATGYRYDQADRLTGSDHAATGNPDEAYQYDANGNRVSSSLHGTGYQTGSGNRLVTDGVYDYVYDGRGNLIRRTNIATGAVRDMAWDYRNRLVELDDRSSLGGAPTQTVQYAYDAFNRRIAKSVDGDGSGPAAAARTSFAYDGQNVILEFIDPDGVSGPAAATKSARNFFGPATDQVLAREDAGGTVAWMLTDHLGTVRDLVSSNGSVVNHLTYDSYGNLIAQTDTSHTSRYRFTGREYDEETGLSFHRARYYDPKVGRFLSEDPIGFLGQDTNLFRYGGGNPMSLKDSSGLEVDLNLLPPSQAPGTRSLANSSSTVTVAVHGKADGKGFIDAKGNNLPTTELASLIRSNPDYKPGKKIVLVSCQSGKGSSPAAKDLAEILNSDVEAPTGDVLILEPYDKPTVQDGKFKTFEPTYKPNVLERFVLWLSN